MDRQFFETARIPPVAGRSFTADDERDGLVNVAIVSARCARRLAPGGNVVGTRMRIDSTNEAVIVGVVGDARCGGVKREPDPAIRCTGAALIQVGVEVNLIARARPGTGDITQAVLAAARSASTQARQGSHHAVTLRYSGGLCGESRGGTATVAAGGTQRDAQGIHTEATPPPGSA